MIDYAKAFDCVDHNKLWKILQEMGIPGRLICYWKICAPVKKQQLEPDTGQQTHSKLGKEYVKATYCHSAYLTYTQSTSWEMLGWMKHKLESRLPGEIPITLDMQMTPLYGRKQRETKEPFDESERRDWKSGLKLNIQKTNIMASAPITSWQIDGETVETGTDFIFWAPKSLQMVSAAMKLKVACSLEEKLWPT